MRFRYQLVADSLDASHVADFQGDYQIMARVSHKNGWNRTMPLTSKRDFSGTGFSSAMKLDLCRIQGLIASMEEKTGISNPWYDLTILPRVSVTGALGGKTFQDEYHPEIGFQIDSNLMRLAQSTDDLVPSQTGEIPHRERVENTLSIFGQDFSVRMSHWIASLVLGGTLLASVWPLRSLYKDWKESDVSRIQVQYHPMLVDVEQGSLSAMGNQIVEVSSFQDLSKMAERYGAMILHETGEDFHRYSVQDERTIYQYILDSSREETLFPTMGGFERSISRALENGELELYYQPVVALKKGKIVGIEAFIRWHHPQFGVIYPAEFISLAEESGMIPHIDQWVVEEACQQLRSWHDFGMPLVPLSINVSPETLRDKGFVGEVSKRIKKSGIDPRYLQLEITRSNRILTEAQIVDHCQQLRKLGVRMALDNYATESANQISQITRMPIDSLKIDRSVIQQMIQKDESIRLINAVVKVAKSFQVEVIAQGVEMEEQVSLLAEQDVEFAQGYLLGGPVQAQDMGWLLGKSVDVEGKFLEE